MIKTSSKERLTKSALITAVFHIAAAVALFSKPIHLHTRIFSQIGKTPTVFLEEENMAILKRNLALEEAFNYFESPPLGTSLKQIKTVNATELESGYEIPPLIDSLALVIPEFDEPQLPTLPVPSLEETVVVLIQPPAIVTTQPSLADPSKDLSLQTIDPEFYSAPLPALASSPHPPASFNFLPSEEARATLTLKAPEVPSPENIDSLSPTLGPRSVCEVPHEQLTGVYADFSISPAAPRSIAGIRTGSSLADYGLPNLELKEWNEFFDVDVKTYAKEDGGFLFSVNLIPKIDLSEYRLKHNFLFVIDRSGSMDKHKYQTAKRATIRALSALRPGDYFNIILLDGKSTQFNASPTAFTKASQQQAEEFLEKQTSASTGGSTDVYTALTKMINPQIEAEEAVTAILISDGDSPLKSSQQRKKINTWLEANRDRVTLYTAAAGQGNNLSSLKMLSLASRGSLLYSDTHAAFPRKLAKLVMDLRSPIAKEMSVSVINPDTESRIELLPPSSRLPNLFCDHPYTLMGSAGKLTDFVIILEGKNKDLLFTVKKTISLSRAKQGSRLLVKQWNGEKAHMLFDQYLREGESNLLKQAEKELGHDTQNSRR